MVTDGATNGFLANGPPSCSGSGLGGFGLGPVSAMGRRTPNRFFVGGLSHW